MKKLNMVCEILAVILMLLGLWHCVVLFRCLQHMNKIWKSCVLICFHISDVIKLRSFSTENLLDVTSVTLVEIYLENIFIIVLLSIDSVNAVWRKEIFWILPVHKFESVSRIYVVDIAVDRCIVDKLEPCLETFFSLVKSL